MVMMSTSGDSDGGSGGNESDGDNSESYGDIIARGGQDGSDDGDDCIVNMVLFAAVVVEDMFIDNSSCGRSVNCVCNGRGCGSCIGVGNDGGDLSGVSGGSGGGGGGADYNA